MSELCKYIDLGNGEENIRSYVIKNFLSAKEMTLQSKTLNFTSVQGSKEFIESQLSNLYNSVGKVLKINNAIVFGIKPEASIKLHVDGYTLNRDKSRNYALNIPIANCDMGVMHWYGGNYTLSEDKTSESLQYLKITWTTPPEIIGSAVIDKPAIVKVDVPHNVHNHSPKHRLILSLRFDPDIPE